MKVFKAMGVKPSEGDLAKAILFILDEESEKK
jgi:hypothetical protein